MQSQGYIANWRGRYSGFRDNALNQRTIPQGHPQKVGRVLLGAEGIAAHPQLDIIRQMTKSSLQGYIANWRGRYSGFRDK
ncbi:hypothetical protein CEXT_740411 [Caerostris extrusa]|uniref:Uncharacterized protein n=1 Tax=Caerostris extrusa TaxID=172846 RepID=A0AAV4XIK9_CAEEX|nr:hypothetical protein CEXT_740411 [Caerostris extrusa]